MKNVTVSLDDETYRKARRRAAEDDRSLSSVVREMLQEYAAPIELDTAAQLRAMWAELDARGEGVAVGERVSRADLYDSVLAERGKLRS